MEITSICRYISKRLAVEREAHELGWDPSDIKGTLMDLYQEHIDDMVDLQSGFGLQSLDLDM